MGLFRNLAVIALFAGAYASNPDDASFQRYVDEEMKKEGSTWLERKVISNLAANLYKRKDFYLFSMVNMPEDRLAFLGLFGRWFRLPRSLPELPKSPQ